MLCLLISELECIRSKYPAGYLSSFKLTEEIHNVECKQDLVMISYSNTFQPTTHKMKLIQSSCKEKLEPVYYMTKYMYKCSVTSY